MDADSELKDIKLGYLSRNMFIMGPRSVHVTNTKQIQPEKSVSAYEQACMKYGIAPSWTIEGEQRTTWQR